MKQFTFIILSLFVFITLHAQQNDSTRQDESSYQTIFHSSKDHKADISGFGAISLDFVQLDGNFAVMGGIDAAGLFNKSFFVGLYGRINPATNSYTYTFWDANDRTNYGVSQRALFGHGGLLVGGVFFANHPIHFGISGRFGVGGITMVDDYSYHPGPHPEIRNNDNPYSDPVFVASPQIDFEMNITHWFKFRLSAGYQFVSSSTIEVMYFDNIQKDMVKTELLNTSSYSSPTFSLGFVFGLFK